MTAITRASAKEYFQAGDRPTEGQYADLIDSCVFQVGTSAQTIQSPVSASAKWEFRTDISVSGNISANTINANTISANSISIVGLSVSSLVVTGHISAGSVNTGSVSAASLHGATLNVTGVTTLGSATGVTPAENNTSTQLATTAFCNPSVSAAIRGFVKLPSGILVQWGSESGSGTPTKVIAFPTNFTTACYSVNATYNSTASVSAISIDGNSVSAGGFTAYTNAAGFGFYWQAIGK